MNRWKVWQRYRYLIIASSAILIATLVLVVMQYRSVTRAEEQARATVEANLDIHLLELMDDARRDTLDHANHIMHSIRQQRVRERNLASIERAFTRSLRRYPEVENFYVVFFDPGLENETWRALSFVPPDATDPDVQKYDGVPVGKLIDEPADSESLRRAWFSISKQEQTTLYAAFDMPSAEAGGGGGSRDRPRQFFFHTVYELDRLKRKDALEPVGLLVFSATPENFPAKNYFDKLLARHRADDKAVHPLLGKLNYKISVTGPEASHDLASTGPAGEPLRSRRFDAADGLFPNLSFGIAPDAAAPIYANEYTQTSIFLGLGAAILSLVGLGMTWRATGREMKVAQLKSDFLASISHELKTPLTAIRAFGDLLHSGRARDAEKVREYGAIIKTESDRLTALINNILEMSRLERGLRRYRLEEGYLCAAVAETVEVFRHSAEAANCTINLMLPSPPVKTKFDESAIRQSVMNLLSNAVKYSDDQGDAAGAGQRIEVAVKRSGEEVVIEVRDFGVGIAPSEQHQIFAPFHRSPQSEVQAKRGTGLGLAIVREAARAHGGEIFVESKPGEGATFRLHLPVLIDAPEERNPQTISGELVNGKDFSYRG